MNVPITDERSRFAQRLANSRSGGTLPVRAFIRDSLTFLTTMSIACGNEKRPIRQGTISMPPYRPGTPSAKRG